MSDLQQFVLFALVMGYAIWRNTSRAWGGVSEETKSEVKQVGKTVAMGLIWKVVRKGLGGK